MADIAHALEYKNASSYQRYEDEALFKDDSLPLKIVEKLIPVLSRRGEPPITDGEVMDLAGPLFVGAMNSPMIPIVGQVSAGMFQVDFEVDQEPLGFIPMAKDPRYAGRVHYALRVDGESMNKIMPNGSYVIVIDGFGQAPRNDDLVIVQQLRSGMVERTVKRVKINDDAVELIPESTDDRFKPLKLTESDDVVVRIEGYVVGSYRPF